MSSFLECRKEISFYKKELTFFQFDERVFSQLWQLFQCSFFVLLSTFSFPQRYFTHTVRDVYLFYRADIVSRCAKIYPQWFTFLFVRKNKHTHKQRNKHIFKTKDKEKQTETERKLETISKFQLVRFMFRFIFKGKKKKDKR